MADPKAGTEICTDTREKIRVARSSVLAAVFLTLSKLVVGIWTGSLGILSEAAHSGLDLVAAVMTWFAVTYTGRPADRDHPYGHHKMDNLSALFETLLLAATCGWIVYEAIQRLFYKTVAVEVNAISFAVIIAAIIVDYSRGRALARVAKRTGSAALEADAVHFLSDIASSGVVLAGLLFTLWGFPEADAVCSIAVALLVAVICWRLGKKAIDALMDRVPAGHLDRARDAALQVAGVKDVTDVRVRHSGSRHFIDLKVRLDNDTPFAKAHELADQVEKAVAGAFRDADVLAHPEPAAESPASIPEAACWYAQQKGIHVHSVRLHPLGQSFHLELHLEFPAGTLLGVAHRHASELEDSLRRQFPQLGSVRTHLECRLESTPEQAEDVTEQEAGLAGLIRKAAQAGGRTDAISDIQIIRKTGRLLVSLTCHLPADTALQLAHELATGIESRVRAVDGRILTVHVHAEPAG